MSSNFLFLLADDIHIHARNFGPLFRYAEAKQVQTEVHQAHDELKKCLGNYEGQPAITEARAALPAGDPEALFSLTRTYRRMPIRVFPLVRAECLAFALATREHWHEEPVELEERAVFDRLYERDRDILLNNLAAGSFWIAEWEQFLLQGYFSCTHAFVFSGSMIYGRVLLELCKLSRTRCFVLESTFTGKEFYVEERYTPIANRSDIRLPTVRNAIALPEDPVARMRDRGKAIQRIYLGSNKNVTQPEQADVPVFEEEERPALLVLGQVVNDFSIIEQSSGYLSSIDFYRTLVRRLLEETDYNVVFKGHPWEHKKTHVQRAFTKETLEEFAAALPDGLRRRFAIREEDNIVALGHFVDRVAVLNSQGGIELAYHCGLRPSTFGTPYWGRAGFSDDYASIDELIDDVREGRTRALLDLEGYEALLDWLQRFLQHHLITEQSTSITAFQRKVELLSEVTVMLQPKASIPLDPSFRGRTMRKMAKLRRDPKGFFRDAKLIRTLRRLK